MPLYRIKELTSFLNSLGISPRRSLSQNFLVDGNIVDKLLSAAPLTPGSPVLEIGPGPGVFTEALLLRGAELVAVECDRALARALPRLIEAPHPPTTSLTVIEEDVLQLNLAELIARQFLSREKPQVIANLPYKITTPILEQLVTSQLFSCITIIIQEEVARRMAPEKPGAATSSFALFLAYWSIPKYLFKIPASCFYPKPKVDSAVVQIIPRSPPEGVNPELFFSITRQAFSQRRKTLAASLSSLFEKERVLQALNELSLPSTTRPEELFLSDFIALYHRLSVS